MMSVPSQYFSWGQPLPRAPPKCLCLCRLCAFRRRGWRMRRARHRVPGRRIRTIAVPDETESDTVFRTRTKEQSADCTRVSECTRRVFRHLRVTADHVLHFQCTVVATALTEAVGEPTWFGSRGPYIAHDDDNVARSGHANGPRSAPLRSAGAFRWYCIQLLRTTARVDVTNYAKPAATAMHTKHSYRPPNRIINIFQ